ncbi:MAG: hypothetical protein K0A89_03925 [ANME-2 cluster archaeon]|nr:hypothetical protein [ANME-2 cluster archaeon]
MLHNIKHLKVLLISALLIVAFFGGGCLDNKTPETIDIEPGNPGNYELTPPPDDMINRTTFFLYANNTVKAVIPIINVSVLDIIIPEKITSSTGKKGPIIDDIVVFGGTFPYADHSNPGAFSNISFDSTHTSSREKNIIHLDFERPMTGFVAYSYTWENDQFYHFLSRNETVIVLLPEGYETGNMVFGTPRPKPDNRSIDREGRVRLVWDASYPAHTYIMVKYYKSSLPTIISILVMVLGTATLVTAVYFNMQIRKLRQMREFMESKVKK